jgi:hypothetical protein
MRRTLLPALIAAAGCRDDGGGRAELVVDDGRGGPAAEVELAATNVGQSATAAVRVTNAGARATGPIALAIAGAAANDFALDNERTTCAGAALPPGEACDVALVFRPRAAGDRRATLAIVSEPGGAAQVELIGQALLPSLVFSPASLDLGRVEAGHPAQATIELRNEGSTAVPLDSIAVSGGGFSRGISTCGAALGPGESCDVAIRLVPQALGPLAGSVVVVSGGEGYAAALEAEGARRVSVAVAGSGAGTVTSAPAGIDCGATCEALFPTDAITLTAAPGASSVLVGWSIPSCGQGPTCAVPAQLDPLAVTVSFALDGAGALDLVFAGDATGEVQVESLGSGTPVTCYAGCTVPLEPGGPYTITPATPSGFGGIAGACTSATGACTFTAPVGTVSAIATFAKDPKERWTRLPGGLGVGSLAYDGGGNLIVSAVGLSKLSPAGATIWTIPGLAYQLATGPADSIYALHTTLRKLDAGGAELWAQPLPPHAQGCASDAFERCLAVGADGAVAVRGATGVARWDASGALSWSLPVPAVGLYSVAIDGAGVVNVVVDNGVFDSSDVIRFAPDGSSLAPLEIYTNQYHAVLAVDGAGQLMATSSGHGSVSVETAAFSFSADTDDPDWVPTGITAAGTGDVLWVYQPTDNDFPATRWSASRYAASGAYLWSVVRGGTASPFLGSLGVTPRVLAAGPSGELAVGGRYSGLTYTGSWIQTFAP